MEENQELSYFNYGNNQIEQQATLNALANNVQSYVNNQAWSTKRKQKFLDAYSDIISKGIIGANNSTGQWALDLNQEIDLSGMSPKDQEMYHEAAYYILEQMKGIPVKDSEEKKEESKDLPLYDNDTHFKAFEGYIGNQMFGGRNWNIGGDNDDWNNLDERDTKTGIRGTTNRALKLADMLEGYSNSLEDGKYNFEGTAFKDLSDLKGRIANAVTQLKNGTWDQNDKDALNQIGLDWRRYFNDGSGDTATIDANGNPISYAQLAAANQAQVEEAAKAEATQKAAAAKENDGVLSIKSGFNPHEARTRAKEYAEWLGRTHGVGQQGFNTVNQRVQELIEGAYTNNLNAANKKELGNLLEYIKTNNPNYQNYNLTPEEEVELQVHGSMKGRRLQDFRRLPWQTSDGRNTYVDNKGNLYFLKPRNQKQLQQKPFTRSAAYNNYKNNFLKSPNNKALGTTIGENNGLTDDMIADLTAMGLDTVSAGAAFAPGYGTLASAISGIGATISGAVADRMRGESWGSTLGTAGFGLSMDILGLIPGAGVGAKAAKIAKVVSKGAKWLGPALGGLAAMSYGPGALSAYKKFTSGKKDDITAEELRDFTYAIRAIATGGLRKAGATYQGNRTLARAKARGHVTETTGSQSASITTKNGQQIKLTDDEFKTLKSNASRETKTKTVTEAAKREKINLEGDEIQWKGINPTRGRFKTSSKSSKVSGLNEPTTSSQLKWNTTAANYKGIKRFSNENLLRGFTTMSTPRSGIWKKLKDRWNGSDIEHAEQIKSLNKLPAGPVSPAQSAKRSYSSPKLNNKKQDLKGFTPTTPKENTAKSNERLVKFTDEPMDSGLNRKIMKRYKDIQRGRFSSKEIESGKYKIGNETVTVYSTKDAKGNNMSISIGKQKFKSMEEAKKAIAKIVQQERNNIVGGKINKDNMKEIGKVLRDLKKMGWLKQGGQINNFNLDKTISEFLNKQK